MQNTETFTIYRLARPEHLQKTIPDGYSIKTINREVLEVVKEGFGSKEEAIWWMNENEDKKELKGHDYTILPIISIRW